MFSVSNFNNILKGIGKIVAVIAVIIMMFFLIAFVWHHAVKPESWVTEMAQSHFVAMIGLPFAAMLSFFIVITLEFNYGTIEFEGLSFKFKGASGPIVLWAFCFLTISVALRMLW